MDKPILILAISLVVFVSGCTSDQTIIGCVDHTDCPSGHSCLNTTCISNQTLVYCEQDNDCVKVRETYCGCTAGGTAITINKNYSELWETQFSHDDIICAGVISTHITCFAQPECKDNICVFNYEDSSVCENFGDYCYFRFAIQNNDIALCEKIESDEPLVAPSKQTCREEVYRINQTEATGFISGRVSGTNETVRVQAIQNLSLIAETTTNPDGKYTLELPEGTYGLLFVLNAPQYKDIVYIYNDETNSDWYTDDGEIIVNEEIKVEAKKKTIIDMDIIKENPDYFAGEFEVRFKPEITEKEKDEIVEKYKIETGPYGLFKIPNEKTVLEMIRRFRTLPEVDSVFPNIVSVAA